MSNFWNKIMEIVGPILALLMFVGFFMLLCCDTSKPGPRVPGCRCTSGEMGGYACPVHDPISFEKERNYIENRDKEEEEARQRLKARYPGIYEQK